MHAFARATNPSGYGWQDEMLDMLDLCERDKTWDYIRAIADNDDLPVMDFLEGIGLLPKKALWMFHKAYVSIDGRIAPFDEFMPRFRRYLPLGVDESAGIARFAYSRDYSFTQVDDFMERYPGTNWDVVADLMLVVGLEHLDEEEIVKQVCAGLAPELIIEMHEKPDSREQPDYNWVIRAQIMRDGHLRATISGQGIQGWQELKCNKSYGGYRLSDVSIEGTSFVRQMHKKNPVDYRAIELRKLLLDAAAQYGATEDTVAFYFTEWARQKKR